MHSSQASQQDQQAAMHENQSRHGRCVQRLPQRRHLLPAAGDLRQQGLQARHGQLHLPRRPRGPVHHLPRTGSAQSADGINRIDAIKSAAFEAIKGTPLEGSRVYLGGTASTFKDMQDGNNYDLMIAGVAALTLIFIIMLHHHAQPRRRGRHRRHRGAVARRILRAVGSVLAAPAWAWTCSSW